MTGTFVARAIDPDDARDVALADAVTGRAIAPRATITTTSARRRLTR
jgi:hypothetical protein